MTDTRPLSTPDLTPLQAEVYAFIRAWFGAKPFGPTIPDISRGLGHGDTPSWAECHVKALERKGLIERDPKIARSMRLAGGMGTERASSS
jgi:repressor LexA